MIPNKDALFKKYGKDHPSKLDWVLEKKEFNSLRKNHVSSPNQLPLTKLKKEETLLTHFGPLKFANPSITTKREATCLRKYGVRNVQQLPIFQKKRKDTMNKKFDENIVFDSL